jgi:RNA polymerase sigma factor (TIGR02999 family)
LKHVSSNRETEIPENVTALLRAWSRGDAHAGEHLLPLVYADLRRRAAGYLRRERRDHTLNPTALVHETYLRLIDQREVSWQNRAHFFGIAAEMMRRILVDHARGHDAAKRGGTWCQVPLEDALATSAPRTVDLVAVDAAVTELSRLDPRQGRLVELRFFGGLSVEETAEVMQLSRATIKREWTMAKAWLHRRLDGASRPRT